jgi:hypothetical protein
MAVPAERKLVVALVVGKRPHAHPQALGPDTQRRLRAGPRPVIFTEADEGDAAAILAALGRRSPAPAQGARGRARRSSVRWPQGVAEGPVKKHDTGQGMARVAGRILSGKARVKPGLAWRGSKQVNTRVVARHNGTSRLRHQRKVRKTLACSTVPRYHRGMRGLAVGLYNFCREHSR